MFGPLCKFPNCFANHALKALRRAPAAKPYRSPLYPVSRSLFSLSLLDRRRRRLHALSSARHLHAGTSRPPSRDDSTRDGSNRRGGIHGYRVRRTEGGFPHGDDSASFGASAGLPRPLLKTAWRSHTVARPSNSPFQCHRREAGNPTAILLPLLSDSRLIFTFLFQIWRVQAGHDLRRRRTSQIFHEHA
jgi:hypothetical protein